MLNALIFSQYHAIQKLFQWLPSYRSFEWSENYVTRELKHFVSIRQLYFSIHTDTNNFALRSHRKRGRVPLKVSLKEIPIIYNGCWTLFQILNITLVW